MSALNDALAGVLGDVKEKGNELLTGITDGAEIKTNSNVGLDNKTIYALFGLAAVVLGGIIIIKSK